MKVELLANGFECFHVAEAVDVDPCDSTAVELRAEIGEVGDFTFAEMIFIILDEINGRADDLAIDEVGNQGGRRGAGSGVAGLKHAGALDGIGFYSRLP